MQSEAESLSEQEDRSKQEKADCGGYLKECNFEWSKVRDNWRQGKISEEFLQRMCAWREELVDEVLAGLCQEGGPELVVSVDGSNKLTSDIDVTLGVLDGSERDVNACELFHEKMKQLFEEQPSSLSLDVYCYAKDFLALGMMRMDVESVECFTNRFFHSQLVASLVKLRSCIKQSKWESFVEPMGQYADLLMQVEKDYSSKLALIVSHVEKLNSNGNLNHFDKTISEVEDLEALYSLLQREHLPELQNACWDLYLMKMREVRKRQTEHREITSISRLLKHLSPQQIGTFLI